jgi:hypothetical protein
VTCDFVEPAGVSSRRTDDARRAPVLAGVRVATHHAAAAREQATGGGGSSGGSTLGGSGGEAAATSGSAGGRGGGGLAGMDGGTTGTSALGGASGGGGGGSTVDPDHCPGRPVTFSSRTFTDTVDTTGMVSDIQGSCNGSQGPDAVLSVVAAETGSITVTLTPVDANVQVVLIIRSGGDPGSEIVCQDSDSKNTPTTYSCSATVGTEYWIVADSYYASGTGYGRIRVDVSY